MLNKIIAKIKSIFTFKVSCNHSNGISKKVKYCGDCLVVIDENNG